MLSKLEERPHGEIGDQTLPMWVALGTNGGRMSKTISSPVQMRYELRELIRGNPDAALYALEGLLRLCTRYMKDSRVLIDNKTEADAISLVASVLSRSGLEYGSIESISLVMLISKFEKAKNEASSCVDQRPVQGEGDDPR